MELVRHTAKRVNRIQQIDQRFTIRIQLVKGKVVYFNRPDLWENLHLDSI